MGAKLQKDRKIIDVFTMEEIDLSSNLKLKCKELGIDYTAISKLLKGQGSSIYSRYISKNNIDKIFVLVDIDTNIEYNCITNRSIFVHLNYKYSENQGKYVYELKSGRQSNASICGKVFKLKDGIKRKITNVKNDSKKIKELKDDAYKRRIIKYRISKRIWQAMQDIGRKKDNYTEYLLGCSMEYFFNYISSKFVDGMNWDNYGKFGWHIDHIRPCSSFDLSDKEQQKKCFHYTNLQPLWATTKIAKQYNCHNYIGNLNKSDKF